LGDGLLPMPKLEMFCLGLDVEALKVSQAGLTGCMARSKWLARQQRCQANNVLSFCPKH
jgi:hypothetical protein